MVRTDSDWAGRENLRKSISGGTLTLNGQWLLSWSKDQSKIARSSGEAELYACNLGGSRGMGIQTIMRELGWSYDLKVQVDANATIGMIHRQCIGKMRHVSTQDLWM